MTRLFVNQPRLLRSPSELPKERMAFPAVKHGHVSLTKENIKPLEQMTSPWPSSLPQGSWLANNLTWCHGNNTTVCHPQRLFQEFQKSSLVQKVQKVNPSYHTQINPIKRVYIHHMSPDLLTSCTQFTGPIAGGPTRNPQPAKEKPRYNRYCTIGYNDIV